MKKRGLRRTKRGKSTGEKIVFALSLVLLIVGAGISLAYENAMPLLKELAVIRAEAYISETVARAAADCGIDSTAEYAYTDDGLIAGVISDTAALNSLRADVTERLSDSFSSAKIRVDVPLGSLCESAIFAGTGPSLTAYFDGVSAVSADIGFDNAAVGLNSGAYTVSVDVTVRTALILPKGGCENVTVNVKVPVERVVISGRVY